MRFISLAVVALFSVAPLATAAPAEFTKKPATMGKQSLDRDYIPRARSQFRTVPTMPRNMLQ
jgi:hypothetical protein